MGKGERKGMRNIGDENEIKNQEIPENLCHIVFIKGAKQISIQ